MYWFSVYNIIGLLKIWVRKKSSVADLCTAVTFIVFISMHMYVHCVYHVRALVVGI